MIMSWTHDILLVLFVNLQQMEGRIASVTRKSSIGEPLRLREEILAPPLETQRRS